MSVESTEATLSISKADWAKITFGKFLALLRENDADMGHVALLDDDDNPIGVVVMAIGDKAEALKEFSDSQIEGD